MNEQATITVKAAWMEACGYPAVDTVLPVVCVQRMQGDEVMYHVEHNGRPWAVWSIRCVEDK